MKRTRQRVVPTEQPKLKRRKRRRRRQRMRAQRAARSLSDILLFAV